MLSKKIRLSGIIPESIVDGPGLRYVLFTQGCLKNCYMCHNPKTRALDKGYLKSIRKIKKEIKKNPLIKGVTFSGGEPFLQSSKCYKIAQYAKKLGLDIISYSGYYIDEIIKRNDKNQIKFLNILDYLIDGPFEYDKLSLDLLFRGSSNQRIIDIKKTLKENKLITVDSF